METEAKAKMASVEDDTEQLQFPQSCTNTKHCTLLKCAAIRKYTCMYHIFKFQGDWHKVWRSCYMYAWSGAGGVRGKCRELTTFYMYPQFYVVFLVSEHLLLLKR